MEDEDIIKAIKKLDPETLREALIKELISLKKAVDLTHDARLWVTFRNCLISIVRDSGIELPP